MNCIVHNNKCVIDVCVCIIIGHVTEYTQRSSDAGHPSQNSNTHAPDDRDDGSEL